MDEQQIAVVDRIQTTFEQVIGDGLRRAAVVGATDAEIDGFAAAQDVADMPLAVRAVLRLIGAQPGLWWAGTQFGVHQVSADHKQHAIATLDTVEHGLRDPQGLLVLTSHQAYAYFVIDGADLHLDDPPVWDLVEHEGARQGWSAVSSWFAATAPDIERYRHRAKIMAELGRRNRWHKDIDLGRPAS